MVMAELDPRFTFESFVVGPANRLASAAARRAAESPGASYNPLFIYAASGLGKTHILGAIAHHAEKIHPEKSVVYQTLEGFLAELTTALEEGDKNGAKGNYEELKILLMDDVQFIAGQTEAQEMLLRTLDALTGEGKQVILASDRPPADINGLDARLRTRFEGGLLVDIGPPEYETRVAIVRRQTESRAQTLLPEVADVIGRIAFKNIRELGGALNRILAIQELEERTVSREEASALLAGVRDRAGESEGEGGELGSFLEEISDTLASQVERQEAPWRKTLRETAEAAEAENFKTDRLRELVLGGSPPPDLALVVANFKGTIRRLGEIRKELDEVGNPWPEAAHNLLRDPDRLEEAEALLHSALERTKPFPPIDPGPGLEALSGTLPKLVIKSAEQLINTDRPEYNPLYVWDRGGESSSTLLRAVGRTYQAMNPGARVALTSVAEFADEFIDALSGGVAGAWRERWWDAELLLVSGAEGLGDTERAQEEFFHLFEALQRQKARIMVAADRPPSRLRAIDDRIRSRFEGGLVLEVEDTGVAPASRPATEPPSAAEPRKPVPEPQDRVLGQGVGSEILPGGASAEAHPHPAKPHKRDVSDLDREWILGMSAGAQVKLGREVVDPPVAEEARAAQREEAVPDEEWFPSPERVLWEWPRFEERVVEEPD